MSLMASPDLSGCFPGLEPKAREGMGAPETRTKARRPNLPQATSGRMYVEGSAAVKCRRPEAPGIVARTAFAGLVASLALAACENAANSLVPEPSPPNPAPQPNDLATQVWALATQHGFEPLPGPISVRRELVILGQALAFDKILSGNRNIACMTCHLPGLATGDGRTLSAGEGATAWARTARTPAAVFIPRNSPAVLSLPGASRVFWDGRVEELPDGSIRTPAGEQLTSEMADVFEFGALSAQGLFPVTSRDEMRGQPGDNELANLGDEDFHGIWRLLMARLGTSPSTSTSSRRRTQERLSAT